LVIIVLRICGGHAPHGFHFLGFGKLLPRLPPDGFPVVLGALTGFVFLAIS